MAEVTMLGRFSIRWDGRVFDDQTNRSQKMWSVLTYLLVHRDRPIPREELIEIFWPDEHSSNPINALKTLLFRIRGVLEPVFGPERNPFLAKRGTYQWNPTIPCRVDVEEFEALCAEAKNKPLTEESRMAVYRRASALYRGDFLPKLSGHLWVMPLAARYHALYLEAVRGYATLLETARQYETMAAVCLTCTQLDPLDETGQLLYIRALLRQGKNAEALDQYGRCTDLLYRELGVRPSPELQELYTELMKMEQSLETDLGVIEQDLQETKTRDGAFYCEYGLFRELYRLEARRATRNSGETFIGLMTISLPNGACPERKLLAAAMEQLLGAAVTNLRSGDAVARYSGAQLVFLLPGVDRQSSVEALNRVAEAFSRQHRRNMLKLTCRTRAVEPGK